MRLGRRVLRLEDRLLPKPAVPKPFTAEERRRMDEIIKRVKANPDGYHLDADTRRMLGLPEKTLARGVARVKRGKK